MGYPLLHEVTTAPPPWLSDGYETTRGSHPYSEPPRLALALLWPRPP